MSLRPERSFPNRRSIPTKGAQDRSPVVEVYPMVAVLPFQDLRTEDSQDHLAEGLADEVLKALSQVEGLRTVSRTTSFPFSRSTLTAAEVGRRLHATAILSGSLDSQKDRLALTANLVDVVSGHDLWSVAYSFDRLDLFATVMKVVTAIASALHLKTPLRPIPRVDLAAFGFFVQGRHGYFRFSRQGMKDAEKMYQRALDCDPDYAPAWAGLAECAAYSYNYIERSETQRKRAESFSRKAMELDPKLAEAHASYGLALSAAGLAAEAEEAFETALRLDPNLFEAAYFYARHCFAIGKPERAIEYFEWASALRPEDFQAILLVAQVYHNLGVEDEAERARRLGLALVEERLVLVPDDVRARYLGANALVALGEREKGLEWARLARSLDPDDPMLLYNLGCIHALAGNPDESLDCLHQAVANGLSQKNWFLHDGDLGAVRSLPRFQALMELLED